jgi:hypothetical protein
MNAHARANEVANKKKELELALLTEEAKIMLIPIADDMDPIQRAWLEKKNMMVILDQDVWFTRSNLYLCLIILELCKMPAGPDRTTL